jgi:hypothetical protein
MKRLLLVLWLASVAISLGAQTIAPRQPSAVNPDLRIRYFDSTGKLVGYLAANTLSYPELLFLYNGTDTFSLALGPANPHLPDNNMAWNRVAIIWFTEAGCTGRGLVDAASVATKRRAVVGPADNILYLSEANPVAQLFSISSYRQQGLPCTDVGPFTSTIVAVDPILNLDSLYSLPFHLGP